MAISPNNTLPNEWQEDHDYHVTEQVIYANVIYRCIQDNRNKPPGLASSQDYWTALDIYKKDATVMPHGSYSGDENFWERDQLYIDSSGYVYLNNENTGINVNGKVTYRLSDAQLEEIARRAGNLIPMGPQGEQGIQGPQGEQGIQGPPGEVTLTPEQVATLKGDTGKSAYQSWLDQGYSGSEADFVAWLRDGIIKLDTELSATSPNGITNAAITTAFQTYRNQVNLLVDELADRVTDLENRLKTNYNNQIKYFRFGITTEGKYGYYISETSQIVPFEGGDAEELTSNSAELNSNSTFQTQIGYGEAQVTNTAIESQYTTPSSIEGSISNRSGGDSTAVYGTNVVPMTLNEAFDMNIYLYNNGTFDTTYPYNLYSMTYNNRSLLSNNEEAVEGIWYAPNTAGTRASNIYIDVEPVTSGATIYYQIGSFQDNRGQLPNLVSTGEYRSSYQNGSFNERTTIEYTIPLDYGFYFASYQQSAYKINAIYIG